MAATASRIHGESPRRGAGRPRTRGAARPRRRCPPCRAPGPRPAAAHGRRVSIAFSKTVSAVDLAECGQRRGRRGGRAWIGVLEEHDQGAARWAMADTAQLFDGLAAGVAGMNLQGGEQERTGARGGATGGEEGHRFRRRPVRGRMVLGELREHLDALFLQEPRGGQAHPGARSPRRSSWLASRASFVSGNCSWSCKQVPEPDPGVRIRLRVAGEPLADSPTRRRKLASQPQAEAQRPADLARQRRGWACRTPAGRPRGARRSGRTRSPAGGSPGPAGPGGCWARPSPRQCRRRPCPR